MANVDGPQPYAFEPVAQQRNVRPVPMVRPNVEEAREQPNPALPRPNRLDNLDWCICQHCFNMPTERESLCCREVEPCVELLGQRNSCITETEDFRSACFCEASLKATLVLMRYTKGLTRPLDHYDNRVYRYAAYRSFTAYVHGRLGQGIRKIIPACAVTAIRQTWPSENGIYRGYLNAPGEVDDALGNF